MSLEGDHILGWTVAPTLKARNPQNSLLPWLLRVTDPFLSQINGKLFLVSSCPISAKIKNSSMALASQCLNSLASFAYLSLYLTCFLLALYIFLGTRLKQTYENYFYILTPNLESNTCPEKWDQYLGQRYPYSNYAT